VEARLTSLSAYLTGCAATSASAKRRRRRTIDGALTPRILGSSGSVWGERSMALEEIIVWLVIRAIAG
jgi:hypothetical protein